MKISVLRALASPCSTCWCVTPALFRAVLTLPTDPQMCSAHRQHQPGTFWLHNSLKTPLQLEEVPAGLLLYPGRGLFHPFITFR